MENSYQPMGFGLFRYIVFKGETSVATNT